MEREEIIKNGNDSIYLIKCLLNGQTPDIMRVNQMNLDQLLAFSKRHKITALLAKSLEQVIDSDVWKKEKNKAIRRTLLFDAERKKLYDYLNENKIWYLPLKGIVLANYYPEYGIREFVDNDILFDKKYQKSVKDYFVSEGYRVVSYNKSNHDIYYKAPIYNFEMHTNLFHSTVTKGQNNYFDNYNKFLHKGDNYRFYLRDSDTYIYNIAHAIKHYSSSGCGIRTLVDIYILNNKLELNWGYITEELKKANIYEIAMNLNELAMHTFLADYIINNSERMKLYNIFALGTFGTLDNKIENQLKIMPKGKILLRRLFIPLEDIRYSYPLIYKHRMLLPLFYILRFGKIFGKRRRYITREFKRIVKHNGKTKKENN